MSLRKDAVHSAGAAILVTASRFLVLTVLARRLDPDALGLYSYGQWLASMGFLLMSFGVNGAASRYIAEYRSRPEMLQSFVRAWRIPSLVLPAAGAALAVIGAGLSGISLPYRGLLGLAMWTLFAGLWAMHTAALSGLQRFDLVFYANLVAATVMLLGVLLVPMRPDDPSLAFCVMGLGCAVAFMVGFRQLSRAGRSGCGLRNAQPPEPVIQYYLNTWITALLWSLVWSRGEVPLVRHFLGDAELAHYSVALSLVGGAVAGVMLGLGGIAPQVTRYLGEGKIEDAVALCRKVGDVQFLVSGCAASCLIWFAPEILYVTFGEGYVDSAPTLRLLAIGLPALSFSMHNHFLQIRTDARFNRNATLLGLVVLGLAAVLLIPQSGIEGAAVARTTAMYVLALISLAVFVLHGWRSGIGYFNFAVVLVVTSVSVLAVMEWPSADPWVRALICLSVLVALATAIRDSAGRPVVRMLSLSGFIGR